MPAQRFIGQDLILTPFLNGVPQESFTDTRSAEVVFQTEIIKDGYLGQFTDRRDMVYRGVRGSLELHFSDKGVFTTIAGILNRARQRRGGNRIIMQQSLLFPNGDRPIIQSEEAVFGEIPLNFPDRTSFATIRLDWEADDVRFIGI